MATIVEEQESKNNGVDQDQDNYQIDQSFEDTIGVTRFVPLNGVPTKILIYHERKNRNTKEEKDPVESSCVSSTSSTTTTATSSSASSESYSRIIQSHIETPFNYDRLILMISGNPGEIEYYRNFLCRVHQLTSLPVIGVSNSGHNRLPTKLNSPDVYQYPNLYDLEGQILNKMEFIDQFVAKRTRLILLGHSIAAYMIIELLDRYPSLQAMVDHVILLYPAMDNMVMTESGEKVRRMFFQPINYYLLMSMAYLLDTLLPEWLQCSLVKYVLGREQQQQQSNQASINNSTTTSSSSSPPKCVLRAATALFNPHCLRALIHMTKSEFDLVKDPNLSAIERLRAKLTILYGERDHWCPVQFYHRLKERASNEVDMRLALGTVDHAFVIDRDGTERIARLVVQVLREKLKIGN